MYDLSIYGKEFYELVEREGKLMAPWFVPLLREVFDFKSLADVGCGTGHYLRYALDNYPDLTGLLGLEGSKYAVANSMIPSVTFLQDFRVPPACAYGEHDLAISIEVAEHVEAEFVDVYLDLLCSLSDTVLITAAVPGQGGTAHVNEQLQPYWVKKFDGHGYYFDEVTTLRVREGIQRAKDGGKYVTAWFEPNVAVFLQQA